MLYPKAVLKVKLYFAYSPAISIAIFRLALRKNLFTGRVVRHWNRPERWLNDHLRKYLKDVCMWHLGMWFTPGLGSVTLMVGLNLTDVSNLKGSVIL